MKENAVEKAEEKAGQEMRDSSLASGPLNVDGQYFRDAVGRTLMLRGVNVSGNAKLPYKPYVPSHERDGFFNDKTVSFVGRPFPLSESDEHFARLRHWGFNFIRLNVTWEALEHEGPSQYDFDFMDYIVAFLLKAKVYGFRVFIDPHQDVWSRYSGGSGAPGWTLKVAGFDVEKFDKCYAAIVHNTYENPEEYPKMIWPTNYFKLATATMFTLFFGGDAFAPNEKIDGVGIQEYLQQHFCKAFVELARRIAQTPGLQDEVVIGYDTLNEPSMGYIGCPDLGKLHPLQELRKGLTPTPFQGMLLGEGFPCEVEVWEVSSFGPRKQKTTALDPGGVKAWSANLGGCIWARHGVWDRATCKLLRPQYFTTKSDGTAVDFLQDFWIPFVKKFTTGLRDVHPQAIMFLEPPVNEYPPDWHSKEGDRVAYAPHWYDGLTLISKHFNTWYNVDYIGFLRGKYSHPAFGLKLGDTGIRYAFASQLQTLQDEGRTCLETSLGSYPCVIGEIGIPYDMDDRKAYFDQDYSAQINAMDCNMHALETNLLNFTLWNYCPDNSHKWGDGWNGEDLSIWSPPVARINNTRASLVAGETEMPTFDIDVLNEGGRAVSAFVRPYPILTPGTPLSLKFDLECADFTYTFSHSLTEGVWAPDRMTSSRDLETEIFVPHEHYYDHKLNVDVSLSSGQYHWDAEKQRLYWRCACTSETTTAEAGKSSTVEHTINIRRRDPSLTAWSSRRPDGEEAKSTICPDPTTECNIL
ncbi:glycoside hydrolase superfamily [Phlyctochytrium arcticum]|nr:glycoside hydrolase superfamily [Phlyctochytrium arcticum]